MKKYRINEIFYSIQCEGYHAGKAAVFVSFAGCNLRCPWCDTDHQQVTEHLTADEICNRVDLLSGNSCQADSCIVVLTGGEPMLQVDTDLLQSLAIRGCINHIETNGTQFIPPPLTFVDWITVSPKPGVPLHAVSRADEVKVVLTEGVDPDKYEAVADHRFIQPCWTSDPRQRAWNVEQAVQYVKEHPWWRLSCQTQRWLGIK